MLARLPIHEVVPEIQRILSEGNSIVVQAPPGAGKSTALPLELLQAPWLHGKKILMLEPRRLAAKSVAARMADQLGEPIGKTIGYRVRFDSRTGPDTQIEVVTEGILTRMLQEDNALEGVGLILFDEFHERSLHADLSLALCREIQQVLREDLRIGVMSATLDGQAVSAFLSNAPIVTSEGRMFPIEFIHLPAPDIFTIPQAVNAAIRKALNEHEGDILVFLPGSGEIHRTFDLLEDLEGVIRRYPLYGDLPMAQQQAAIMPATDGIRKVVLATSIAETSLTIEGVRIVIDSGYARVPRFDPRSGMTRLETVNVTRDAADQRAGRAGRTAPGVCYRLWERYATHHMVAARKPEIMDADLAPMMLELAQWGTFDPSAIQWLTPPPTGAVAQAREMLISLDAVSASGAITVRGREMLRLPTHPRIAHMLLEGMAIREGEIAAALAALLEERDPLSRKSSADLSLRIELLLRKNDHRHISGEPGVWARIRQLQRTWMQLLGIASGKELVVSETVGRILAFAYPERIAQHRTHGRYRLKNGRNARLSDGDPLASATWLAIAHVDAGTQEGRIFLAAPLDIDTQSQHFEHENIVAWDSESGQLISRQEKRLGALLVSSESIRNPEQELRIAALLEAIRKEGKNLLDWSERVEQLVARVASLHAWRPEELWPEWTEHFLLESCENWLPMFLQEVRNRDQFRKIDIYQALISALPWEFASRIDQLAPEFLVVPTGSRIRVMYTPGGTAPVLAVRLQEVFGMLDTPTINDGRTPVQMHLLSPAYRPVQVTMDLRSFWLNTYADVRKDLRGRYPKHSWPEDPLTAEPVRGVKKNR